MTGRHRSVVGLPDSDPVPGHASDDDAAAVTFGALFRNRDFAVLYFASAQSLLGDQLARVALAILVFTRTGSGLATAATYALTFLPAVIGGLLLSGLADSRPRRGLMVICDLVRAGLFALMAIPGIPLPLLCVLLVVAVLAGSPYSAAEPAVVADIFTGAALSGRGRAADGDLAGDAVDRIRRRRRRRRDHRAEPGPGDRRRHVRARRRSSSDSGCPGSRCRRPVPGCCASCAAGPRDRARPAAAGAARVRLADRVLGHPGGVGGSVRECSRRWPDRGRTTACRQPDGESDRHGGAHPMGATGIAIPLARATCCCRRIAAGCLCGQSADLVGGAVVGDLRRVQLLPCRPDRRVRGDRAVEDPRSGDRAGKFQPVGRAGRRAADRRGDDRVVGSSSRHRCRRRRGFGLGDRPGAEPSRSGDAAPGRSSPWVL